MVYSISGSIQLNWAADQVKLENQVLKARWNLKKLAAELTQIGNKTKYRMKTSPQQVPAKL